MPDTIAAYHTFVGNTRAKASEVNRNFSNYRGTILPVEEDTSTASDNEHDLGSSDHRWRNGYIGTQLLFTDAATSPSAPLTGTSSLFTKDDGVYMRDVSTTARLAFASDITTSLYGYEEKLNSLLNSGFFAFQENGTAGTVSAANGASTYLCDQWYVRNSLGTSAVIAGERITASLPDGVESALQAKITTGPSAATSTVFEVCQPLDNLASLPYYNAYGSAAIAVKAVGNVSQVGLQFMYATSEVKLTTEIGSEVLLAVSTGGWSTIEIDGQAMGTTMTTSGIVGVRVRPTAVSSGHISASGNGIQITKAIMVPGLVAPTTWRPAFLSPQIEVVALQKFYRKSKALATVASGVCSSEIDRPVAYRDGSKVFCSTINWEPPMRTTPTVITYNTGGNQGVTFRTGGASEQLTSGAMNISATATGFSVRANSAVLGASFANAPDAYDTWFDYSANARI
jgi:hypothetical protein